MQKWSFHNTRHNQCLYLIFKSQFPPVKMTEILLNDSNNDSNYRALRPISTKNCIVKFVLWNVKFSLIRLNFTFHNTRHNTDFHQKMAKMVCEVYCDAYFVTIQGVYCDASQYNLSCLTENPSYCFQSNNRLKKPRVIRVGWHLSLSR